MKRNNKNNLKGTWKHKHLNMPSGEQVTLYDSLSPMAYHTADPTTALKK